MTTFGQVITAMVTPFDGDGEVNYPVAEKLAAHLVQRGSDALVVCGTTGESPTLTREEEFELFRVVKGAIAGSGAKLIAGTGSNCTREALEATEIAAKIGVDGTLQVVPYYNKPPQEGIYEHFRQIAAVAPDLPCPADCRIADTRFELDLFHRADPVERSGDEGHLRGDVPGRGLEHRTAPPKDRRHALEAHRAFLKAL